MSDNFAGPANQDEQNLADWVRTGPHYGQRPPPHQHGQYPPPQQYAQPSEQFGWGAAGADPAGANASARRTIITFALVSLAVIISAAIVVLTLVWLT